MLSPLPSATPEAVTAPRWWALSMAAATVSCTAFCLVYILGYLRVIDVFWSLVIGTWGIVPSGLAWLALLLIGALRYRRWKSSLAVPFVVLMTTLIVATPLVAQIQIRASTSALDRLADECPETRNTWAGAVYVIRTARFQGHCFLYRPGGFIDEVGLVRLKGGPPTNNMTHFGMAFDHVTGDWYRFAWHP
ncbi:MAG: hypothetical protein WBA05_06570 [Gordonia sp. (in: high G+C Gram-positive bacteria)]|uniref:hypothetical protein n=1 Tax=Gordonia TaxID=2053 RepID=UPI0032636445